KPMHHEPQTEFAGGPSTPPPAVSRGDFIKATYLHLAAAVGTFAVLSAVFMASGLSRGMLAALGHAKFAWLAVLGAFMLGGWLASSLADNAERRSTQLTGLGIYVVAESLFFAPLLAMASAAVPGAIGSAVVATLALVAGLSYTAFTSKSDFSFLGGILKVGG